MLGRLRRKPCGQGGHFVSQPERLRLVIPSAPWTRALEEKRIQIFGLSYEVRSDIDNAPDRFIATHEETSHVGENGVRRIALDVLAGKPGSALPVWFGREHMARNLIVRADSGLNHPRDLAGKRVGSRLTIQSGTGAAVLMMYELGYGLDLRSVTWVMGDPTSLPENRMGLKLEPGARTDEENFRQLLAGELDAVMLTGDPRYWSLFGPDRIDRAIEKYPGLRPLITDPEVVADVYRRTKLYPISDLVTIKPDVAQRMPEAPRQLLQAFGQANGFAKDYRPAEEQQLAEREIALLGEDPHVYGLTPDARTNLAAFLDFLYRMGAIGKPVPPEELFEPSVR
jgi:4,5-dihydroxyphthalate decarboxylase